MGFLRRLRNAFRRKKAANNDTKGKGVENLRADVDSATTDAPVIIHKGTGPGRNEDDDVRTITRAEMEGSGADEQSGSIFFARLPLEIRQLIYREIWRGYLKARRVSPSSPGSDLRLHIYTDGSGRVTLGHTQCKIDPGAPSQEDAQVIQPFFPFDTTTGQTLTPPMWFWLALVMRFHWDKHWKCQHAIMKRWDPQTGKAKEVERSPFLPLFLTCKKMYWETVVSFFENVTPIFTSSEDAYRFFVRRRHPFLDRLRSLEFSFTNHNDHLYLSRLRTNGVEKAVGCHGCTTIPCPTCRPEVFGQELWVELLQSVRTQITNLRDFDITVNSRTPNDILRVFGHELDDDRRSDSDATRDLDKDEFPKWQVPGKLVVYFKSDYQRYMQDGSGRMVRETASAE
ncbi:hypothetical protein QBC46DRAFT_51888 [Diplogelasinospora grovesii]|uniref:Uncharacterized protein n=1 Tax=Diplogelasinospora grovesii TaxID=303347 RepID=A0AAN6N012_9PEZI|nr:hypothetical protein QBC46DRAFT_51888 [Diplogelasinospora grovesii]